MTHTKDEAQPATEESSATQPAQPPALPVQPVAWPCVIAEADFEQDTITLKMQCSDYKVGAGKHWLHTTKPAQPAHNPLWLATHPDMLTTPPAPPSPEGTVLLPKRMTQAMRDVTDTEDWTWEDLLAAAEAITEGEYNELAAPPAAQKAIEFGMNGEKMMFKVGVQQFTLDYEPDTQDEFNFMRDMLANAFSTFTPDVKTTPAAQPAVQEPKQTPPFTFRRFVAGSERAQDVAVHREVTLEAAVRVAAKICPPSESGHPTVLVYTQPAAQPAVPDAITDSGENPEYRAGWNECRETMLQILKARTL